MLWVLIRSVTACFRGEIRKMIYKYPLLSETVKNIATEEGYPHNIFLISHENICCGYSLEAPQQGASNEYPQHMFCGEIRKISAFFG